MPQIFFNMIKQYSDKNPIVGDFFGMIGNSVNKKIEEDKKIDLMKRVHELEYQQYNLRLEKCEKLCEVIIVIGVLNKYMRL
jgi:hypothetical protein